MASNNGYYTGKDQLEFSQIVLTYLNKILEILSKELAQKKQIIPASGMRSELVVEEEDTRKSFSQAVEGLATILSPWFNEDCKKYDEEFDFIVNVTRSQYLVKYKDEIENEFKAQTSLGLTKATSMDQSFVGTYREWHQVIAAKTFFRKLNNLLHENDYLKGSVYGEGLDDMEDSE